jgi:hypothetical protein
LFSPAFQVAADAPAPKAAPAAQPVAEPPKGPIVVPGQGPNPGPQANEAHLFGLLDVRLSAEKEEFAEGEPIVLTVTLENTGERASPIAYAPPQALEILANPQGWKERKGAREPLQYPKHPALTLYTGAYYGTKFDALKYYEVPPGEYRVKAKYSDGLMRQNEQIYWNGSVESNEIRIVVKANPAKPPEPPKPVEPAQAERIKQLIKDLGSDDWEKREKAADELAKIGQPIIEPLLAVIKESDDPEVVWRAQIILREIGYTTDEAIAQKVQAILDGIKANDWTVKETLGLEIVRLGPRVIGTLKSFLDNPDYRIRQVVVELLGKIPDKQIVQILIDSLSDKDKYVTASAAKELRRISGQTFASFEKEKWQEWWNKNKETFHLPELPPEPPKPQPEPLPGPLPPHPMPGPVRPEEK